VGDEQDFAVMGGSADTIAEALRRGFQKNLDLSESVQLAVKALGSDTGAGERTLEVEALEVAILDRNRILPRKFRRIRGARLAELLTAGGAGGGTEGGDDREPPPPAVATAPPPEVDLPPSPGQ